MLSHHAARHIGQRYGLARLARGAVRLLAGQREQLLDQVDRPLQPLAQLRERGLALGFVVGALGQLQLQLQRGERCAQFVGGVGDEGALGGERVVQPAEQAVERLDQRLGLGRHVLLDSGAMASGRRLRTAPARRSSGRRPRPTRYQIMKPISGRISSSGLSVRSAAPAAMPLRTRIGWATWITRSCSGTEKTRQLPSLVATVV